MATHICINGRVIEYTPSPDEASFIEKVEGARVDPATTDVEIRALIYGTSNPLLDQAAGYSFVTAAAFENPVFRVLLDLLDQKRVAQGTLDLEQAAARYALTVAQAAERLGIRDSAVRAAVLEGRLPSWKKDGQIFLDPASVDSYEVSRRGRPPQLLVTCGNRDGASLRVRVAGGALDVTSKTGGLVEGKVDRWARVAVLTGARAGGPGGDDAACEFWLLEPGGAQRRVESGPFKVVGRFTIREHKAGQAAASAWDVASTATEGRPSPATGPRG